jgi:hypothetical protein
MQSRVGSCRTTEVKKKREAEVKAWDEEGHELPPKRIRVVEQAKSRLSKWAARLFDPDRPRGVIEPPQVIPLNDEFLQAFGRREKEYDEAAGMKKLEVDNDLKSDEDSLYSEAAKPLDQEAK